MANAMIIDYQICECCAPNCNSQQETFAGKNGRAIVNSQCKECGIFVSKSSSRCKKCYQKSLKGQERIKTRKCQRPEKEILLLEIAKLGYCGTGRKYGVSDNAIRKWTKAYP